MDVGYLAMPPHTLSHPLVLTLFMDFSIPTLSAPFSFLISEGWCVLALGFNITFLQQSLLMLLLYHLPKSFGLVFLDQNPLPGVVGNKDGDNLSWYK